MVQARHVAISQFISVIPKKYKYYRTLVIFAMMTIMLIVREGSRRHCEAVTTMRHRCMHSLGRTVLMYRTSL